MIRLGLFGGTFDPVHYGHLLPVEAARVELNLPRVLMLPNPRPPHKLLEPLAPYEHRKAMLQIALADFPHLELADFEEAAAGPGYTTETVQRIIESLPAGRRELWLIIGADSLIELPHWKDPETLFRQLQIAALPRPGFDFSSVPAEFLSRVRLLTTPRLPISATEIRRCIRAGMSTEGLLPVAVREFIDSRKLYRT